MTTISHLLTAPSASLGQSRLIPEGANRIQVDLAAGPTRELTDVQIGRFFVFGLLEDKQSWGLIRLSSVLALKLQSDSHHAGSAVIWTRKAAGELIGLLNLPASAVIGFREQPRNGIELVLLGATKSLVATDSYKFPFIPFQAISYLEIAAS